MIVDDLYRDVILDHHRHPRGRTPIEPVDTTSHGVNPTCGDEVTVRFRIEQNRISEVQVDGSGCAISTAAGSMMAEKIRGMKIGELRQLAESYGQMLKTGTLPDETDLGDLIALEGVNRFAVRVKCAMLPMATALQALDAYEASEEASEPGAAMP